MGAVAAVAVYVVVTALLFRDLLPHLATDLYSDVGDPLLNTAILAWNARHVPLTSEWWNFPSFAPLSGTTAFTEHLLGTYPIASPIIWTTGNAVLAYNVVLLAAFPLNGWGANLLAREITGSPAAAFVGGLAFAFAPYHSVHLSHLQMLHAVGMPLALYGLHRYHAGRRSGLAVFAIGWLVTALSSAYALLLFPVLVVLWCVWFIRPRDWRRLASVAAAALLVVVLLVPLLSGYQERLGAYGFTRELGEIRAFSADMVGVIGISHRELLWRGILPNTYEERALFPGATILALAVAGVAARLGAAGHAIWPRRLFIVAGVLTVVVVARAWVGPFSWHIGPIPLPPFLPYRLFTFAAAVFFAAVLLTPRFRDAWARRDVIVFYACAVVVLWLFALGPLPEWSGAWRALSYGPYWLFMLLPGPSTIRVPARIWLPAVLCLSVLAAAGTSALLRRVASDATRKSGPAEAGHSVLDVASGFSRKRAALLVALSLGVVAEGWFFEGHVPAPAPMPEGVIPRGALVLDLPIDEGFFNATPQYRAVLGGYRTLNGYSGYQPAHFLPMRRGIADLKVDALTPFIVLADLYVVIRDGTPEPVVRFIADHPGATRLRALRGMEIYRIPRLNRDAPRVPVPLPLPRRGARPFGT